MGKVAFSCDARRGLRGQLETEMRQQETVIFFGLSVASKEQPAAVGGREASIEHLDGSELFEHSPRGKSRGMLA